MWSVESTIPQQLEVNDVEHRVTNWVLEDVRSILEQWEYEKEDAGPGMSQDVTIYEDEYQEADTSYEYMLDCVEEEESNSKEQLDSVFHDDDT